MYPRRRLESLTDGIYGVAMTLLVLDIRIPDDAVITTDSDFVRACLALWSKVLPYVISFFVLASGWLSASRIKSASEGVGRSYAVWWQWQLLFVTFVPATTIAMGRFTNLPIAIALYALNIGVMGLCGYQMLRLLPEAEIDAHYRDRRVSLALLIASCVLTAVLAPLLGAAALYAFLVNFAAPVLARRSARRG